MSKNKQFRVIFDDDGEEEDICIEGKDVNFWIVDHSDYDSDVIYGICDTLNDLAEENIELEQENEELKRQLKGLIRKCYTGKLNEGDILKDELANRWIIRDGKLIPMQYIEEADMWVE